MKNKCSQYCKTGKMFYVEYYHEISSVHPHYIEYEGKCGMRFFCKRYWIDVWSWVKLLF